MRKPRVLSGAGPLWIGAARPLAVAATICAFAALTQGFDSAAPHRAATGLQAHRAATGLDVLPFPGTPDATAQTQVEFPALEPSQVTALTVVGSRSGAHHGRLTGIPNHRGAIFVPDRPFVAGDRVTVTATLRSGAAAAAVGAPGERRIRFTFGVVAPAPMPSTPGTSASMGAGADAHIRAGAGADASIRAGAGADASIKGTARAHAVRHDIRQTTTWTHSFHSESWLHPPIVWMSGRDPDPYASGDIFASVQRTFVQAGPIILNPWGQLVWFNPLPNGAAAFNTQMQSYEGRQVLTYWQGYTSDGWGQGDDVMLNHSYQTVATVRAGNGLKADLHEFYITPQGDAFITVYEPVSGVDLSSVGGPTSGTLLDSVIQEIDIATGQVLWEWHAYGHVHLAESYAGRPNGSPYDFFHINSIQPLPNGNLLVSARHTWAVYEINMQTGRIPYVIGGKHSSFKMGPGANFEWQHDATLEPDGHTLDLFDDAWGYYKSEPQSRALRINLNFSTMQATLDNAYTNNPPVLAQSQGSVQVLPDGNTFVGWGSVPYFTEFSRTNGAQLFNLHFHYPMQSYRGYRFGWWGQPATPPDIAVSPNSSGTTVYAAWNGATAVSAWRVLAGPSPGRLSPVGQFPKTYFETTMSVNSTEPYFAVQALRGNGQVLGTSATVSR